MTMTEIKIETEALARLVTLPVRPSDVARRRRVADQLGAEGALFGLSRSDATLVVDAVTADLPAADASARLRSRSDDVLAASDTPCGRMDFDDREAVASALAAAAWVIDTLDSPPTADTDLAALRRGLIESGWYQCTSHNAPEQPVPSAQLETPSRA